MEARTIDDLALSPEGEVARAAALAAIVDGIPVDLEPLALVEPEPERAPETYAHRIHRQAMRAAFSPDHPKRRGISRLRGTAPSYKDTAALAWWLGGESVEVPFPCSGELPEPEVVDGEILWGASVTIEPSPVIDAGCAFEAREVEVDPPTSACAQDVAAWLEGLYEPLAATELVDLTGYSYWKVAAALRGLHDAGLVARQETQATGRNGRSPVVWVWRRLRRL